MTTNEPGLPLQAPMDATEARLLSVLAPLLHDGGSDALIGVRTLLREVAQRHPGELERMAAGLQRQRLGLSADAR